MDSDARGRRDGDADCGSGESRIRALTRHSGGPKMRTVAASDVTPFDESGIRIGDVLANRYRVERVLGQGGMGTVLAARHVALGERVAIKLLRPQALKVRGASERFLQEARAAAKIKNEHVARVVDVAALDDGSPYMVMEYLEGRDLGAVLEHTGPFPIAQAVDDVLQVSEAIAEAHQLGIIHRDLKPANLLRVRTPDGEPLVKVLDFGVSKFVDSDSEHGLTRTNELVGSPYYMSPEQMQQSKSVDLRTDIWSMGVILFELITGKLPFDGESVMQLAIRVATEPAPALRSLLPTAPPELESILFKCLEKDRRRRYDTLAELSVALSPFGSPRAKLSADRIVAVTRNASSPTWAVAGAATPPASAHAAPVRGLGPDSSTFDTRASSADKSSIFWWSAAILVSVLGAILISRLRRPPSESGPSWAEPASALPSTPEATAPTESALSATPPPVVPTSTVSPSSRPTRSARPERPAHCDPPFTIDDEGRKHFKHECFGQP
jgi:eukaryotic-like serine/threonine-protein kinase